MAQQAKRALHEREVEVKRSDLITTLMGNREKHVADYRAAVRGYKEQARRRLEKDGAKARESLDDNLKRVSNAIDKFDEDNPGDFRDHFTLVQSVVMTLPVPKCYSDEYDAAIDIAKWDVNDTMKLTFAEFNCFVRDQWDWKSEFELTNSMYT